MFWAKELAETDLCKNNYRATLQLTKLTGSWAASAVMDGSCPEGRASERASGPLKEGRR